MDSKKLIIKTYPQFDHSASTLYVTPIEPASLSSEVVIPMYKEKSLTFIGLKEGLGKGELLRFGMYPVIFVVLDLVRVSAMPHCRIYRIRRLDQTPVVTTDLETTKTIKSVCIVNRRGASQLVDQDEFERTPKYFK